VGSLDGSSACGFVAVMGVTRSGMSVYAGMLHKLGVPMGKNEHLDTSGRYEDKCFRKLNSRVAQFMKSDLTTKLRVEMRRDYVEFIRSHANLPIWGLKDPAFYEIWPIFDEALHEVLGSWDNPSLCVKVGVVVVHRGFRSTVQSIIQHHEDVVRKAQHEFDDLEWAHTVTPVQAINRVVGESARLFKLLAGVKYPVLHVEYEKAVDKPIVVARELTEFIGTDNSKIEQAASIVSPKLRHF